MARRRAGATIQIMAATQPVSRRSRPSTGGLERAELRLDDETVDDVRETHISWVFLTRERAFKVKKAIALPFLDYGTPARRLEMCRAELELNRRLAPDVYTAVRSLIPAPDGRLRVGAEDDPDAVCAPMAVLEARVRARAGDPDSASDAGLDVLRTQLREREPLDEIDGRNHRPLRTDRPVDEIVAAIADALD